MDQCRFGGYAAGWQGRRAPASMLPSKLEDSRKLLHASQAPKEVANVVGVSLATLYRHLPASERQDDQLAAR